MSESAIDFYTNKKKEYCEPCDKIFFMEKISSANESFISYAYNLTLGTLTVSSDMVKSPVGVSDIEYIVYYDNKLIESDKYTITDGSIHLILTDLSKLGSKDVKYMDIIVRNKNQSVGVKYSMAFNMHSTDNFKVTKIGDTYTISDNISETDSVGYIDWGSYTYIWSIDGKTLPSTTYSCEAKDTLLSLYTKKSDAELKLKIVEIPDYEYTDSITIDRNKYSIAVSFEDVINGTKFYKNISITHNATGVIYVKNFIDGVLIAEDYFDAIVNSGKQFLTVITKDNSMTSFDVSNIESYEAYVTKYIEYINTDKYTSMLIDSLDGNIFKNSTNSNRLVKVPVDYSNDFKKFKNKPLYNFNYFDKDFYIKKYEMTDVSGNERLGMIYNDTIDGNIKILNNNLVPMIITDDKILDKYDIIIDEDLTNIIPSLTEFDLLFNGDTSKLHDLDGYIELIDSGSYEYNTILEVGYRLKQIEFEIQYIGNTDNSSKITVGIFDKDNILIKEYGYTRGGDIGVTVLRDDHNNVIAKTQESFESRFVVRVTSGKTIDKIVVSFVRGGSDRMGIKNIILTGNK